MILRRRVLQTAAFILLSTTCVQAQEKIGLAEKRAIVSYQQERFPALKKAIQDAAGFPVAIEVEWDQLAVPGDAKYYAEEGYFGKTIFEPIAAALRDVGKDQMGRDALELKLKTIRVRYDEKSAVASNYEKGLKFEAGILDVNWRPFANVDNFRERVVAITQMLEKNL